MKRLLTFGATDYPPGLISSDLKRQDDLLSTTPIPTDPREWG